VVTPSATPTFPVDPYYIFSLTLNQNVTSSTVTGSVLGQEIMMYLCQNNVGGFTFAWDPAFLNPPAVPAAPNACITPIFVYNGTNWIQANTTYPYSPQTVVFSATPVFNSAIYNQFNMTLTGNVTSSTLSSGYYGQPISFNICQDGTGGRTFVWPTNFLEAPTVASASSACTTAIGIFNGTSWNSVGSSIAGTSAAMTNCLTTVCSGGATCPTTSTYVAATVYTNCSSSALVEEVTFTSTDTPATGGDSTITGVVAGSDVQVNGLSNQCVGARSINFTVLPSQTFEVTLAQLDGCGSASLAVTSWWEVTQ
jgi:hypothetical protein